MIRVTVTHEHYLIWRMLHVYWNCFHVAVTQWICPLPKPAP